MASVSLNQGASQNSGCCPVDSSQEDTTTHREVGADSLGNSRIDNYSVLEGSDSQLPGLLGPLDTIEPLSMLSDRLSGVTPMVAPGKHEHRLSPGTERLSLEQSPREMMPKHQVEKSANHDENEECIAQTGTYIPKGFVNTVELEKRQR